MNSPPWSGSTISGGVIFSLKPRMRLTLDLLLLARDSRRIRLSTADCLRRARTVRNPILAEEFEKLAKSWLRLAKAAERDGLGVPLESKKREQFRA